MGNCDTHVFLGSNSFKTVEYFSKALGEKTIERDSTSISRDRQNWKTGKSVSDQIMARALMTPDELRRLDNDVCIIFEKGIKPVKANKYYYFKHRMAKEMASLEISHNDIGEVKRGEWRKFNPYNPYVEDDKKEKVDDLKVESLDDLFEDEPKPKEKESIKPSTKPLDLSDFEDAPVLPQQEENNTDDDYDLQKELEAKFDELFGPVDNNN